MQQQKVEFFEFRKKGKILPEAPVCGMTLRASGSMRFRWNEVNPNRDAVLEEITRSDRLMTKGTGVFLSRASFVPVQLEHTHIVYDIKSPDDTFGKIGDGIITKNRSLIPVITVADCMPIYLFDPVTGVFGIVHSGWKGTGIICDAIKLAGRNYGSRASDFCLLLGPHIRDCCYIVNKERADWFRENFSQDCVRPLEDGLKVDWNTGSGPLFHLSLEKANLAALTKLGLLRENIWIHPACTCCTRNSAGDFIYGSNRRETTAAGAPDKFTVQAAFIIN